MSTDLSWDTVRKIHDHFAAIAKKHCDSGAEVAPQVFLLDVEEGAEEPKQGTAIDPEMMSVFMSAPEGKQMLAAFIRDVLTEGAPIRGLIAEQMGFAPSLVLQVTEAWVAIGTSKEDFEKDGLAPSQRPDRKEAVVIALFTTNGPVIGMHMIENSPKRHCVLAELPRPGEAKFDPSFGDMSAAFQPSKKMRPMH